MVPKGWFYFEQVNYVRLFEQGYPAGAQPHAARVDPAACREAQRKLDEELRGGLEAFFRHKSFAGLLLPGLGNVQRRAAKAQAFAHQAALACALERYHRAHGQFPETLDALVPQFLEKVAHDVVTEQPLQYRRAEDGQFILYSVGWDMRDDGGTPGKDKGDDREGDWVWQLPER